MPGGLSEPMEPRFGVRHLRSLGALTVVLALASCGGDSTQESTSTAASSTTTTPSSIATTTPSSTTTTPSSTTSTPAVFLSAMVIEDDHPSSGDDATPVEIGTATQGELEHDYDSDVFAFEATGGERYELDVTLGTLQDSVLVLYDADDSRLFGNDDYADSTASRLIWLAPATGTYYALVHSFATGTGTYTLTITISDIEDDHPNSTDNATPVETGIATQGELEHYHDRDFFRFEATEGEYYELDATLGTLGTLQAFALSIHYTDGTWLTSNDDYRDSTASRLIWLAPSTGTYYVEITGLGTGTGTYALTITISDIEDDHPNLTDNATPVETGIATQGELEYGNDRDFFRFEATEGEYYVIDATLGTLQDSVLDLYDADGTWLSSNDDYRDSTASRLIWLAPSTGTYYIRVHSFATVTGTYTLTVARS